MKRTSKHITLLSGILFIATAFGAKAETKSEKDAKDTTADTTEQTTNYPEKLIHDFPYIYTDTAYSSEDYNVVVRAVWMAQRGRKTKVTSPDQLPASNNETCVRFASFESKTVIKNAVNESNSEQ